MSDARLGPWSQMLGKGMLEVTDLQLNVAASINWVRRLWRRHRVFQLERLLAAAPELVYEVSRAARLCQCVRSLVV